MSFCPKGSKQIIEFLKKAEAVDQKLIPEVTDITGKIKAIEGTPTVEKLVEIIPNGSVYEGYLNAAMDEIVPALKTAGSLIEKLITWLGDKAPLEKNGNLLKLASTTVANADNKQHTESFYDTAVQTHIEGLK